MYSTLSYNIAIWGGSLLVYQLARLKQLHEKIIYSLFSYHARSTDINEIHRCIGVLKIDDIYRYHAMIYMFNIANCNVQSLLYGFQENMGRRNRFTGALRIPIPKNDTQVSVSQHLECYSGGDKSSSIPLEF